MGAEAKVASVGSSLRSGLLERLSSARSSNKENRAEAAASAAASAVVPAKLLATAELVPDAVAVAGGPVPEAVAATSSSGRKDDEGNSNNSRSRAILLLTDGEANVGVCDPQEIIQMASSAIKSQAPGARLITFGNGEAHNTSLIEQLAVGSGGSYRFVENEDQVAGLFADCLGGLTSVAAQAVRVVARGADCARLSAAPRRTPSFPASRCPTRRGRSTSRTCSRASAGTCSCRSRWNLLLPLALPALAAPVEEGETAPAVSVKLAYMDATSGAYTEAELVLCVARPADRALCDAATHSPDVREQLQLLRHEAARAMEAAQSEAESGRVEAGRAQVKRVADDLRTARAASAGDDARAAVADAIIAELDASAGAFASTTHYHTRGSKMIRQQAYELNHERCTTTATSEHVSAHAAPSSKSSLFRTSGQEALRKRAMDLVAAKQ